MLRRLVLVFATISLLTAGCAGSGGGDSGSQRNVVTGDADEGIQGVQAVRVGTNVHTLGTVDYGLKPPAGGAHNPIWVNCGFYDQPFPDENLVHDLEHGAVWLAYNPTLPAADIEVIHDLARSDPKVIATPYADLPGHVAVVATAWARQLTLNAVYDPRLAEFVTQYQDGSHAPESGGRCDGTNLGQPIP